jgi:hypothetical protein
MSKQIPNFLEINTGLGRTGLYVITTSFCNIITTLRTGTSGGLL